MPDVPVQIRMWFPEGKTFKVTEVRGVMHNFRTEMSATERTFVMSTTAPIRVLTEHNFFLEGQTKLWEFDHAGQPTFSTHVPLRWTPEVGAGSERSLRAKRRARANARKRQGAQAAVHGDRQ